MLIPLTIFSCLLSSTILSTLYPNRSYSPPYTACRTLQEFSCFNIYVERWHNEHSASDVDSMDNIFMFIFLHHSFNSISKSLVFLTLHSSPKSPVFWCLDMLLLQWKTTSKNLKADDGAKGILITIIQSYFHSLKSHFSRQQVWKTFWSLSGVTKMLLQHFGHSAEWPNCLFCFTVREHDFDMTCSDQYNQLALAGEA